MITIIVLLLCLQVLCTCFPRRMQKMLLLTFESGIFLPSHTMPTCNPPTKLLFINTGPPRGFRCKPERLLLPVSIRPCVLTSAMLFVLLCRWSLPLWRSAWASTKLTCGLLSITPSASPLKIIIRRADVQVAEHKN